MAQPRRRTDDDRPQTGPDADTRKKLLWGGLALLAAVVIVGLTFTDDGDDGNDGDAETGRRYVPVDGFADVHGLAVDPEDPEVLYIATHHGLIRATNGTELARVGDLEHDYMGFSAHPTESGVFWASGHPSSGGNMGVRKSTDGGFTWQQLAFEGRVDFHAMTVSPADPDVLWGHFRGQVYQSVDGGQTWQILGPPPDAVFSFAAHPTDADMVHIGTREGHWRSQDGGTTWELHREGAYTALAVHGNADATWYAAGPAGIERSTDGGATWNDTAFDAAGTVGYLALHPEDPDVLYAATYQTGLYRSTDGGASWQTLIEPSR